MYSFKAFDDAEKFTFPGDILSKIPYLSAMRDYDGDLVVTNITKDQLKRVYECMVLKQYPSMETREILTFIGVLPEDSYEFSLCVEDDMRKNMYVTPENYTYPTYSLLELNEELYSRIFTRSEYLYASDIVFTHRKKKLVSWSTFKTRVSRLSFITLHPGFVVAGGYLFTALLDTTLWKPKDVDIFLTNTSLEEANSKVLNFISSLPYFESCYVKRTENALTIINDSIPLQVILRLYQTPSEVVHGFDVDCCGMLYYNNKVYVTERCYYSLVNGYNIVNFDRLSPSYEHRLIKYGNRGMGILVPNFNKASIKEISSYSQKGLGKILRYESMDKLRSISHQIYKKEHLLSDYDTSKPSVKRMIEIDYYLNGYEYWSFKRINIDKSVYVDKIEFSMYDHILINNLILPKSHLKEIACLACYTPCVLNINEEIYQKITKHRESNLKPNLEWKVTNPGEQMTGTFHKLVLEDNSLWYKIN